MNVGQFFSEAYINIKAVEDNPVLYYLYRIFYPIARLLNFFKLSPNLITFISLVFALFAATAIIFKDSTLFFLCWFISIALDFCDGTVARMKNKVSKMAFRVDHTSDLIKIYLIICSNAIYYSDQTIWVISTSSLFFFMSFTLINHDLGFNRLTITNKTTSAIKSIKLKKIYRVFCSINGHTLFIFMLLPISIELSYLVLFYFASLSLFLFFRGSYALTKIIRPQCTRN
jgi:phosphatidylglycerophosphate synthase